MLRIPRACYWAKKCHEIYPLDAELNLPEGEYSYTLQEWTATLGSEVPYDKAANFLETVLGVPLWGSVIETVMNKGCVDVPKFYENRQKPDAETEKEIIVATGDGKGVVMRKDQLEKKIVKKRLRKMRKKGERIKKKQGVALVDGEHKLRKLMKKYLPWFLIIIDIYHVMEYLWKVAHIFHREGSSEAEKWMTDKLTKVLFGKIKEVIAEFKELSETVSGERKKQLSKVITYLENGKTHMRYDIYLKRGYPIGSGVVEGACKNLVKDRMEQCGMRWTIDGAEAVLGMRSIQINKMTSDYWKYHLIQQRKRLYGSFSGNEMTELAA